VGCYVGGLSKLCHKCVTDIHKRLHETLEIPTLLFVMVIHSLQFGN
jgi:hypothetical protein